VDAVIRAAVMYVFLVVAFRLAGKHTLAEVTTFDLVLLLIIAEATGPAMLDGDSSFSTAALVVITLIGMELAFAFIQSRFTAVDRLVEGMPVLLVDKGEPLRDRMRKLRVDEEAIMEAARALQGLERIDQVKYAVLERSGQITIIPAEGGN
jgi:uncharacterized membrane protein YcaP (DUF421 family)